MGAEIFKMLSGITDVFRQPAGMFLHDYHQEEALLGKFAATNSTYGEQTGLAKIQQENIQDKIDRHEIQRKTSFELVAKSIVKVPATRWHNNVLTDPDVSDYISIGTPAILGGIMSSGIITAASLAAFAYLPHHNSSGSTSLVLASTFGTIVGCAGAFYGNIHTVIWNLQVQKDKSWVLDRLFLGLAEGALLGMGAAIAVGIGGAMHSPAIALSGMALFLGAGVAASVGRPITAVVRKNLATQREEAASYQNELQRIEPYKQSILKLDRDIKALKHKQTELLAEETRLKNPKTVRDVLRSNLKLQRVFLDETVRATFTTLKGEAEANLGSVMAKCSDIEKRQQKRELQYQTKKNSVLARVIVDLKASLAGQAPLKKRIATEISAYEKLLAQLDQNIALIDEQIREEDELSDYTQDYELIGDLKAKAEIINQAQAERADLLESMFQTIIGFSKEAAILHHTRIEIARDVELVEARVKVL